MADKPVAKRGRPTKAALQSTKDLSKRQQAAALKEFRARLLLNPKSPALIEKMFDIAFDDEHKQQAVALKLLADRLMPVAGFTADGKQQAQVSINISGIGVPSGSVTVAEQKTQKMRSLRRCMSQRARHNGPYG